MVTAINARWQDKSLRVSASDAAPHKTPSEILQGLDRFGWLVWPSVAASEQVDNSSQFPGKEGRGFF